MNMRALSVMTDTIPSALSGKLRSDLNAGGIGQLADKLLAVGECLCLVGDDDKVALSGRGYVHLGSARTNGLDGIHDHSEVRLVLRGS